MTRRVPRDKGTIMEIFPNPPFAALMTLPFLVAFVGLHFILFKPLYAYLDERTAASRKAREQARKLQEESEQKLADVEQRLDSVRREIVALRAGKRATALEKEAEILAVARQDAENAVNDAIARLEVSREAAAEELRATARSLSTDIAGQVLGRTVH